MALLGGPGFGEPFGSWPGPLFCSGPVALCAGRAAAGEPCHPSSQETPCDQRPWSHPQAPAELRSRAWLAPAPARNRTRARVPTVAKRRICCVILLSLHRGAGRTCMARRSAICKPSRAAPSIFGKFSHEPMSGVRRAHERLNGGDPDSFERERSLFFRALYEPMERVSEPDPVSDSGRKSMEIRNVLSKKSSAILKFNLRIHQRKGLTFSDPPLH